MIEGVGIDIIEISRIRKAIVRNGKRFLDSLFLPSEQKYCLSHKDPSPQFAARFSAKEAAVKALGVGFRDGIHWHDFEVVHDPNGKPFLKLSDKIQKRFNKPNLHLSMSHSKEYATAIVVWERP